MIRFLSDAFFMALGSATYYAWLRRKEAKAFAQAEEARLLDELERTFSTKATVHTSAPAEAATTSPAPIRSSDPMGRAL